MQHNDLIPYVTGAQRPARHDRELVGRARGVYEDVVLSRVKVDGAMAIAGHIMEGVTLLDARRRALAGDNAQLNAVLGSIELNTVHQVEGIQRDMFGFF